MSDNISIKDVARLSGVSIATVSNALNGRRNVSPKVKQHVLEVAEELGYRINPIARNLKRRRSDSVAVIISDINCIFFAPLLKGIERMFSESGYTVTICDVNFDQQRAIDSIRKMRSQWIDGVLLCGMSGAQCCSFLQEYAESGMLKDMPIVNVERDMSSFGIDSVFIDNYAGAYQVTSHLIELGCRRILHIAGQSDSGVCLDRTNGYRDALASHGIALDQAMELQGNMLPVSGCDALSYALGHGIPFDGVFAANDQMAVGALRALKNARISVPETVKLAGFDNTFISSIIEPALTTISVPNYEMGKIAARMLMERISTPDLPLRSVKLEYELIVRRSTMASAKTCWDMAYW